jgi:hypothetical protein
LTSAIDAKVDSLNPNQPKKRDAKRFNKNNGGPPKKENFKLDSKKSEMLGKF